MPPPSFPSQIFETQHGKIEVKQYKDGLKTPWSIAFLPDETLLITLKQGQLKHFDPISKRYRNIENIPKVVSKGQGGLLDVAVSNNFDKDQTIFLSYSRSVGLFSAATAVMRAKLQLEPQLKLTDHRIIYEQTKPTSSGFHYGSRIVVKGEDIYITNGDRGDEDRAQDVFDTAGSIIRVKTNGSIPKDNPFASGKKGHATIWSYGHRNPQGLALDELTGEVWSVEHGARGGDEINLPQKGKNYGWPIISYGTHYSGGKIGIGTEAPNMEQPKYYWDPSIAPSGMTIYRGALFPQWQGDIFVGALKDRKIVRLEKTKAGEVKQAEILLEGEYGRIRDVRTGPKGAIWFITDSEQGGLYQIIPAKEKNP